MPMMMTTTRTICTMKARTVGSRRTALVRPSSLRAAPDAQRAATKVRAKMIAATVRLMAKSPSISMALARMVASTVNLCSPAATT